MWSHAKFVQVRPNACQEPIQNMSDAIIGLNMRACVCVASGARPSGYLGLEQKSKFRGCTRFHHPSLVGTNKVWLVLRLETSRSGVSVQSRRCEHKNLRAVTSGSVCLGRINPPFGLYCSNCFQLPAWSPTLLT